MGSLGSFGGSIGGRFQLVIALPCGVLVLGVVALVSTGAFASAVEVNGLADAVGGIDLAGVGMLVVSVELLGLLVNPFHFRMVQLLEGYWSPAGIGEHLWQSGVNRHKRRLDEVNRVYRRPKKYVVRWWMRPWERTAKSKKARTARRKSWAEVELGRYPGRDRLMPTRLGNALRQAEDQAGDRYGLDAVRLLPYLYSVMSESDVGSIEDARSVMDTAVSFVYVWATLVILSAVAFVDEPWLMLIPLMFYALMWISYEGSVSAARLYGRTIVRAVDLHRLDVITRFHFPLPVDLDDEYKVHQWIERVLTARDRQVIPPPIRRWPFKHP